MLAQLATGETGTITAVINQLHTGGGPLYARFAAGPLPAAAWPPTDDEAHVTELVLEVAV